MPTYSYRCPKCGREYDKFQKISDTTLAGCPDCGTRGERVITGGAGLLFKGSGFYITDYKRAGEKGAGGDKASGGEKAAGGEESGAKSDTSSPSGEEKGGASKSGADS
jgi:putative FmdB family regulatory protein